MDSNQLLLVYELPSSPCTFLASSRARPASTAAAHRRSARERLLEFPGAQGRCRRRSGCPRWRAPRHAWRGCFEECHARGISAKKSGRREEGASLGGVRRGRLAGERAGREEATSVGGAVGPAARIAGALGRGKSREEDSGTGIARGVGKKRTKMFLCVMEGNCSNFSTTWQGI
jgi:hypothetical protein